MNVDEHQNQSDVSEVTFRKPRLWSLENPQRYVVVTSIEQDGKLVDGDPNE